MSENVWIFSAAMSRFFATGSDSESVSSESDEEVIQKPVVATKFVVGFVRFNFIFLCRYGFEIGI